jgi:hypothetical protein
MGFRQANSNSIGVRYARAAVGGFTWSWQHLEMQVVSDGYWQASPQMINAWLKRKATTYLRHHELPAQSE